MARRPTLSAYTAAVLILATSAASCSERPGDGRAESREGVSSSPLTWGATITLQENSDVVNVAPNVHRDAAGNFIVADPAESQVRIYTPSGTLVKYFGRKGDGPDEFQGTVSALDLPSGDLVIVDAEGKVARVRGGSERVSETHRLPLSRVYSASLLGDSHLLVAGRALSKDPDAPLMHVFDLESFTLSHSFFPPPTALRTNPIERNIGFINATVRGDTVAVVYAVSDTVYLFRSDGTRLGRLPLQSKHFRPVRTQPPGRGSNVQDLFRWMSSFSFVTDVFWAPGGDFLVQYQDRDGTEIKWRLSRITRTGKPAFDIVDTPRLLSSNDDGSHLIFVAPNAEAPNVWVSASLSR